MAKLLMYEREIVIENYKNQTDEEVLHSLLYVFWENSLDINACYERSFVNKLFAPSIQVPECSLPNQSSK